MEKSKLVLITAVVAFLYSAGPVAAEDMMHEGSMMEGGITAEMTESGAIKVGNPICPISKEKVGEMGDATEYEYNGKVYNFCCPMCLKDFKKDPEKYVKMIDEMMAADTDDAMDEGMDMEGHEGHDQ